MKCITLALAIVAVAVPTAACGNPDKSRDDAADTLKVNHTAPEVVQFNNHFPNVEDKCDGHGHRIFVQTHDSASGQNMLILPDPTCPGFTAKGQPPVTVSP